MRVMVTGGGHGIGKSLVDLLLEQGHEVVVFDHNKDYLEGLPGEVETYHGEVFDEERVREVVEKENFSVLVNNAGYQKAGALEDMESESFEKHFKTNVFGAMNFIRHSMKMLREKEGRVVNVSSVAGRIGIPLLGAYSGSKFALRGLTDSLRVEMKDSGVDVVLVEPGVILTGFNVKGMKGVNDYLEDTSFEKSYEKILERAEQLEGASVEKAGKTLYKAVTDEKPGKIYRVPWKANLVPLLTKILPLEIQDRILMSREDF